MKAWFIAPILVFSAATAHAVHVPGTFNPSQCGEHQQMPNAAPEPDALSKPAGSQVGIHHICVGEITGEGAANVRAVQFTMTDGTMQTYKIDGAANYMIALREGNIKSMIYLSNAAGEKTTMGVIRTQKGVLVKAYGTLGNANYFVPRFETMYTVQGF